MRELYYNVLLGQEGILSWDGTKTDSQTASIGMYIVVLELFHLDGDTHSEKLLCVLADHLN